MLNEDCIVVIDELTMDTLQPLIDDELASVMSAEQTELIQAFTAFLSTEKIAHDQVDDPVDLFLLFKEMAELKNEVKLESRQIKRSLDDYKELIGLLKSNNELLSHQLRQQNEIHVKSQNQQRHEAALGMIRFCDYLELSLETMRRSCKTGWRSIFSLSRRLVSVVDGQELLLSRFTALLKTLDVKSIVVIDKPFDASTMCAVEACCLPNRENGVVISELK